MLTVGNGGQNIHKYYDEGPEEFRNVPDNFFKLTDERTIQELNDLYKNSQTISEVPLKLGGT
jgi:hypothetical protein